MATFKADDLAPLQSWLASRQLSRMDLDCFITIKLKIMDGKCKMPPLEKQVISAAYTCLPKDEHSTLGADIHQFIAAQDGLDGESDKMAVYEKRLLAETIISRPVMKAFKAKIRQAGIYEL